MQKLLRLLGYRRTFGGKVVRIQERDNLTSFPQVSEEEAREIKERQRLDDASIYAK